MRDADSKFLRVQEPIRLSEKARAKLWARDSNMNEHLERADHLDGKGIALFDRACELDLEGIVAKHRNGRYTSDADASTWFKIRNRNYSQWAGRNEAFERDRHREPTAGWHACEVALAAAAS